MSGRVTRETLHGQVIYPRELPHRRGNMYVKCSLCVAVIIVAACVAEAVHECGEYTSFLVTLVVYLLLSVAIEILTRMFHYTEEKHHIASRYNGSHLNLLKKLFTFTSSASSFIVFCVFCGACIGLQKFDIEYHVRSLSLFQMIGVRLVGQILPDIVQLSKNPVNDSVFLENLERLDYGSGMAQNFFYGYLRLVLPHTGDQEKGILERIEDYISKERLPECCFPVKKLFILIPSSTYIPNDLKDISFGWMENAGSLQELVKYRAGVRDRVYKNTVYKIKDPDDNNDRGTYVVLEGATPCKTLYEVMQNSGARKEFYKEHLKEIVFNFYETLREMLREDRDCREVCEFIYYVAGFWYNIHT